MILARGAFGKLPCKGENILMGTGHTCSADLARDRVWRMLRGHGDFLLWEIKNPAGEGEVSGKIVRPCRP
jgi:hypothetical protein